MTKLMQMIITVMFMSPSCLLLLLLRSVWVLSSRSLVISHMEMSSSETLLDVSGTDRVQLVYTDCGRLGPGSPGKKDVSMTLSLPPPRLVLLFKEAEFCITLLREILYFLTIMT